MLWEFWVLSREKPKIYSFSRFLHISPCWWLICLVRDEVSGRRVICVLVTWRKPVASCCSARSPPLSRSHWSRRSRAATCFLLQPIQRLFKNFHCFRLSVFLSTGEHNFTERISILYFSGGFFQTEKCWREMGVGKDDHVALERKSFIDFELGDASKEEAKEEDASLTEKKQIIDAIGSKDNPVENLSNWFGSERRSTSSLCEKSLTVLLLKCVVNLSNWQKKGLGSHHFVCATAWNPAFYNYSHIYFMSAKNETCEWRLTRNIKLWIKAPLSHIYDQTKCLNNRLGTMADAKIFSGNCSL